MKTGTPWGLGVAATAFLLLMSCATVAPVTEPPLPISGPWTTAQIRGSIADAALLYREAGGPRGRLRFRFISWIQERLEGLEASVDQDGQLEVRAATIRYKTPRPSPDGSSRSWDLSAMLFMPYVPQRNGAPQARLEAPIVSFQHGTQVNRTSAPSRYNPNFRAVLGNPTRPEGNEILLSFLECSMGAYLASLGYIVVMPDYPGYGDNRDVHPYCHLSLGDSVRDAVLEAIEALRRNPDENAPSWNGRVYLIGYSEGGYATMAGARSLSEVPNLDIAAAVPCAGAYDLSGTMARRIPLCKGEINPHFVPFTFVGYEEVYGDSIFPDGPPFKDSFAAKLPLLFDGGHWAYQAFATLPRTGTFPRTFKACDILRQEVLEDLADESSPLFAAIRENDAYRGWKPSFPMLEVHCGEDEVVPVENALAALRAFEDSGSADVELLLVPPVDMARGRVDCHTRAFPTALIEGLSYILGIEARHRAAATAAATKAIQTFSAISCIIMEEGAEKSVPRRG